jgi:replicative DNA helicase
VIHACLPVEARVIAGMLCEDGVLEHCDDVESDDFVDMRHVVVFNAIRAVQSRGDKVEVVAVIEAIEAYAIDHGAFGVLDMAGEQFIQDLINKAPPGGLRTIRRDVRRLRSDREFRELLMRGARP